MPSVQTTPKRRPPAKPARSILIYLEDGKKVLVEDIPGNAKVTFGKFQPGPHYSGNALRIYTVESNQLAVFCNVSSFRDLSLTVKEQTVHRRLKENAISSPNGNFGESEYETEYSWGEVAIDAPPETVDRKKNGGNPFNQF